MALKPITTSNSNSQNFGQINDMMRQLNNEQVVKVFKQPGGNAVVQGKLPSGGYGTLYYDSSNVARILIGQAPDDGRIGIWVSKAGVNVIDELNA